MSCNLNVSKIQILTIGNSLVARRGWRGEEGRQGEELGFSTPVTNTSSCQQKVR